MSTRTDELHLVGWRALRNRALFIGVVEGGVCHICKRRIASEELAVTSWKDAEAPTLLRDLIDICRRQHANHITGTEHFPNLH
jgi:hypothetical protein